MTDSFVIGDPPNDAPGGDSKEDWFLGTEQEQLAKALVAMERQRYWLRFWSFVGAGAVAVLAVFMELVVLCHILTRGSESSDHLVFLAIAPIVPITLIVIFVLVATFRGYRDKDMSGVPTGSLGRVLGENGIP